ncbi:MAG: histidine triad nucleotide-binding protein [Oligoflexales bacterium]|nr:histidine triad nucleotide-binding protein [Oligoflexales bacterium]
MSEDITVFEKILKKWLPANVVYEDSQVMAFTDINPVAPTHVLVIPKKKVGSFMDLKELSDADVGVFFKSVAVVAEKIGLSKDGYRVVLNCGEHGQQSVNYMHAHIIGGRQLKWPPG